MKRGTQKHNTERTVPSLLRIAGSQPLQLWRSCSVGSNRAGLMMKMRNSCSQQVKGSGSGGMNSTRAVFELKRKVVVALNKLADRDTYQLGIRELEGMVESLNSEGVLPFLSCIMDMDSDQKTTVRKECVRLMGCLASLYPHRVVSHVGKMVSSIVKRLKDMDSVVRDACIETIGILASELGNCKDGRDGMFVSLMKPLFEALGEQNKQLQSGSALCLSKVIDCTHDPPLAILEQLLNRSIKLLKNPHFVAKPAVIQLKTSIIKSGGAPSQTLLSAAMQSIQEALKSSDWNTRKAASVALGDIASSEDPLLEFHRASCIHELESCRFDKVKPVREAVLQALKGWQCHPIASTPENSPQTSSLSRGDYLGEDDDVTSVRRAGGDLSKAKFSSSERTLGPNFRGKPHRVKKSSWQLEMRNSKSPSAPISEIQSENSVKSSIPSVRMGTNTMEFGGKGMSACDQRSQYARNGNTAQAEKNQFLLTPNVVDGYCKSKFASEQSSACLKSAIEISAESNPQSAIEDVSSVNQSCFTKSQDRNSFDSNLTDSRSQVTGCCCMQTVNTISSMKKQLSEIENKQSAIVELLQALTETTTDSLKMAQSKVAALGTAIDQIAHSLLREGRYSDKSISRFSRGVKSSSDSSYFPSPSDGKNSKLPSMSFRKFRLREQIECNDSSKGDMSMWATSPGYISDYLKDNLSNMKFSRRKNTVDIGITRETDSYSETLERHSARDRGTQDNNGIWKRVKSFLTEGDLESAYAEALCSEDELHLVELLDQSTPVIDSLTRNTANNLLTALASLLHQGKKISTIIPWIRQIVNLSSTNGLNYLGLPLNLKKELLAAIHEAAKVTSPVQKRSLSQLHARLYFLWGKS